MTLNQAMRVSTSGLTAERFRMDVIAGNIANANSTQVGAQAPYRRRDVALLGGAEGVQVERIYEDASPFQLKYEPGNPEADERGYVRTTNVQPVFEMVDMMGASRAYEANIQAFNSAKGMIRSALGIGKI